MPHSGDPDLAQGPLGDRPTSPLAAYLANPLLGDAGRALAGLIAAAGSSTFYAKFSRTLADIFGCEAHIVVRYSSFDLPELLVNRALTEEMVTLYFDGLYRLDPLLRLARDQSVATVVNLKHLTLHSRTDQRYLEELFTAMMIYDELAVLLPGPGGVTVAICCERADTPFTEADLAAARNLLALLEAVHTVHVEKVFVTSAPLGDQGAAQDQRDATVILDRSERLVYASPAWKRVALANPDLVDCLAEVRTGTRAQRRLDDDRILHWEPLPDEFALAPGGTIVKLERGGHNVVSVDADQALDAFRSRHNLTPREAEIVRLVLIGYPNARIAETLGISVGTVKNHRHRLYYKLDITSEREMFHMFLSDLVHLAPDG